MNTEEVPAFIGRRVPSLSSNIAEAISTHEAKFGGSVPLGDSVMGVAVTLPARESLTRENAGDRQMLTALFHCLEDLLTDSNPNMADFLATSLFEYFSPGDFARARKYMGPRVRKEFLPVE